MIFEDLNLNKPLLKALEELDYIYPTPIQEQAFSVIMSGASVVGIAQTGTGKTFAYLLPLLRMLPFSNQRDPRVLIIAPTHELVMQILEEVQKLTKYTGLRSLGIYGGANISKQKQAVYDGTDIIVATPGRFIDLALTGVLGLKSIQKLVIDEVDEMMSLGFRTQITNLLGMLPEKRQNLMFSATLTPEVEELINLSFSYSTKIEIAPHGTPLDQILQKAYHVPNFNTKVNLLEYLLTKNEDLSKVLIFVSTKKLADRLYEKMNEILPNQFGVIHSNKAHNTRVNAVNQFVDGTHRALISTDVIARGMDISDVSHVINFDLPETQGDYLHRIGRTGRADKVGIAISFINEMEEKFQLEIEVLMEKEIPLLELPEDLIISEIYGQDERPDENEDKGYLKRPNFKVSQGAFHEKSEKNKQVNSGSPSKKRRVYTKGGKRKHKRPEQKNY